MTVQLAPPIVFQSILSNGAPNAFGTVATYVSGTTTPQATYIDSTQTTQNQNPTPLNALGQASIWLATNLVYKIVVFDALGNQINFQDQIVGGVNLTQSVIGQLLYPQTAAEISAGITPLNFTIPPSTPIDLRRYGQTGSATPDNTALTSALAVANGSGVIALPPNFAGANPSSLAAGITIIDYRVAGTFPGSPDLLGGGRWINIGGNPEGSIAGFHTQQWVTSPSETSSAILGTNKFTGNLTAGGGGLAGGTFEVDTVGTLTGIGGNIVQGLTGQTAIRSLGQTIALVVGVEGGGGIDRTTTTTNINTIVGVQGDQATNVSTAGATITNAYGGRFVQSTAPGILNNNFACSMQGDCMFRVGDHIRIENGGSVATIALTFTDNTHLNIPAGVTLALAASIGVNGASPPAQVTGFGTPVGGAVINNYNITDAGGANSNTNKCVAEILTVLKSYGLIGN